MNWALLTGEYPPDPGGVGDYAAQVARGLAEAGDGVHVYAPGRNTPRPAASGIDLHELARGFSPAGFRELSASLGDLPSSTRLLLQYVPHSLGLRGVNLPFCAWLTLERRHPLDVVFHEVHFPLGAGQPLHHNFLGGVQCLMAALLLRRADRVFITVEGWERVLRRLGLGAKRVVWLPVPSNLPTHVAGQAAAQSRAKFGIPPGAALIGHFGTYAEHITSLLAPVLCDALRRDERRHALLVGRGSVEFAGALRRAAPELGARIHGAGGMPGYDVAAALASCTVLLQPYSDGASARRSSLLAGLALGVPTVSNAGFLTDTVWKSGDFVALTDDVAGLQPALERVLQDEALQRRLSAEARAAYAAHFSLEHAITRLRGTPESPLRSAREDTGSHDAFGGV